MPNLRDFVVRYTGDIKDAVDAARRVNQEIEESNEKSKKSLDSLEKRMGKVGQNLTFGLTAPILATGAATAKAAMDAVESENLFEVSMGGMAREARAWSEAVSDALGQNSYEVRKNVATFNVMLDSMKMGTQRSYEMAKGLTQLSYDMSSFYNLNPEEAFDKLKSGITGEIEPLKSLGLVINETQVKQYALNNGLIKQGETLTEQQKILARYGLIMEQTKKAQGDLGRTMESSVSNQAKAMTAEIKEASVAFGMDLLPTIKDTIKEVRVVTKWFSNLSAEQRKTIIATAAVAAAAGPVISGIAKTITALATIRKAYLAAAAAAKAFAGSSAAAATGAGAAIAAAGALAYVSGKAAFKPMTDAKKSAKEASESDKEMIAKGFKRKSNGGWEFPKKGKATASKATASKKKAAPKIKVPKISGGGKVSAPKVADIDDFEDAPTLAEIEDERAQKSMEWTENMFTLHRITEQERYDAYSRILEKNKHLSLSMLAQVSSMRENIGKEIEDKRMADLEAELDRQIEKERKDNEKWLKELARARKRSDEYAEKQMIQLELDAMKDEAGGNALGASLKRNKADWMSSMLSNLQQTRTGKNMDMANKLAEARYAEADRRSVLENARNVWERIKAFRQEAEEKRKSVQQQLEAERQRLRGGIRYMSLEDMREDAMLDSVRRQYGPERKYIPSDINAPASAQEIIDANVSIYNETKNQTELLQRIANALTAPVPAF